MKVQLSATIDADLSVKLSNKINESNMSKSAYIQALIEKDLGANESVLPVEKKIPKKKQFERLVIDVLKSSKKKTFTRPPIKYTQSELSKTFFGKFEYDGEYYYPYGKDDFTFTAIPIGTLFADERLVSLRKPELEDTLNKLMRMGRVFQPVKDCFEVL